MLGKGGKYLVLMFAAWTAFAAVVADDRGTAAAAALVSAVRAGDLDGVKRALRDGASLNVRDEGSPLLHLALALPQARPGTDVSRIVAGRIAVARYLLSRGTDVNATDGKGITPLHLTAMDPRLVELIEPLVKKGADPNATVGHFRETPLILAVDADNRAAMKKLLQLGADVNKPILDGITPLLFAVLKGEPDSAALLLEHGADIEAPNDFGVTPLAMAITLGRFKTIDLLLGAGADPDVRIGDRPTPRELALTKDAEIQAVFQQALARHGKTGPRAK